MEEVLNYLKLSEDSTDLKKPKDYSDLIRDLEHRLYEMKQERTPWESTWRNLATYIKPQDGGYLYNSISHTQKGEKSKKEILDNSPLIALRTLAAGMLGGMSSPTKPWFRLSAPKDAKDNRSVRDWLTECEERVRAVMHRSNLYSALSNGYYDMGLVS